MHPPARPYSITRAESFHGPPQTHSGRGVTQIPAALLIDADAAVRHEFASALLGVGCVVEEADDARVALAMIFARPPDLVMVEARLPGLSGIQLAALLRADVSTAGIPIVGTTSDARFVGPLEASGADAVLLKPCSPDKVVFEVGRVLSQSATLRTQARDLRIKAGAEMERSMVPLERSRAQRRTTMSHELPRGQTTRPVLPPPGLACPACDRALTYKYSHTGGVNAQQGEQWDYFECSSGCGVFQFRHRTNKVRRVV